MTSARRLLCVLLLVPASFFAQRIKTPVTVAAQQGGYSNLRGVSPAERTSIIRILASPDAFDGKRVLIEGFFHFEFEDSAIYLHQVDSDQMLSQNAIWINLPKGLSREALEKLNNHYVICEGQFSAQAHGHMGIYPGEISDIRTIHLWPSRADFQRMQHPPTQP